MNEIKILTSLASTGTVKGQNWAWYSKSGCSLKIFVCNCHNKPSPLSINPRSPLQLQPVCNWSHSIIWCKCLRSDNSNEVRAFLNKSSMHVWEDYPTASHGYIKNYCIERPKFHLGKPNSVSECNLDASFAEEDLKIFVTGFWKTILMGFFFVKMELNASLISSTLELTHLQVWDRSCPLLWR